MPLPVVPGGAVPGAPGAPPPAPSGEVPAGAGFDALFQQLTGALLATSAAPGAAAPADVPDEDAAALSDAGDPAVDPAAVVAGPVPVPVAWGWTPAVVPPPPATYTGAGEGIGADQPVIAATAGDGAPAQATPYRRGSGTVPAFAERVASVSPAEPEIGAAADSSPTAPGRDVSAASPTPTVAVGTLVVASGAAAPAIEPAPAATASTETPGLRTLTPTPMPPVQVSVPRDEVPGTTRVATPAAPPAAAPADTPALDAVAAEPRLDVAAPSPAHDMPAADGANAAAVDRGATRPAREARQGRVDPTPAEVVPVAPPGSEVAASDAAPAIDAASPAAPIRRPVPAGALAAMERLAASSATPTASTGAAVATRGEAAPAPGAFAAATNGGGTASQGDTSGGRGREAGQLAPDRSASSFRIADTGSSPWGSLTPAADHVTAPGPLRGAAADLPLAPRELEPALADSVHQQVVKSIRMQWGGGIGEARVSLKPEFLGEVTASINVERGVVTATLHADTPEVRTFLETHAATLREALAEHGLRLDRLEVAEPEREPQTADRQGARRRGQQEAPPKPRRREPEAPPATFELISE